MRFYTTQHRFYCGIDLHARTMRVCIRDQHSTVVFDRNVRRYFVSCGRRSGSGPRHAGRPALVRLGPAVAVELAVQQHDGAGEVERDPASVVALRTASVVT
jgi:hypothetical protein